MCVLLCAEFLRLSNCRLDNMLSERDDYCDAMLRLLETKKGKIARRIKEELATLEAEMVSKTLY